MAVAGANVQDWEDLASAPCRVGSCLYIADVGDNRESRERITISRLLTEAELQAHAGFVASLGETALWRDYLGEGRPPG